MRNAPIYGRECSDFRAFTGTARVERNRGRPGAVLSVREDYSLIVKGLFIQPLYYRTIHFEAQPLKECDNL